MRGHNGDRQGGEPGGRSRSSARGSGRDKGAGGKSFDPKSSGSKSGLQKSTFTPGRVIKQGTRDQARPKPVEETREPFILPPRPEGPAPRRAPFALMVDRGVG
ncbi:hypothetical protein [uncultured Cohaesibacter sp.]|uniref:hypothetical protein n=1 Tax=uncultured Cohaesibacter sp. TaxID=1002546 RepID=UPI0029C7DBFE|nr:hypothetical protein [uncultured Cohaesibacter sp.]